MEDLTTGAFTPSPLVSVIIPMYNVEKYIAETLNSILAQSFKNFEVVVVDDCSTDDSVKIAESFIPKFAGRLKIMKLHINNGNPADPRNLGLTMSRGKYVFFMDSDDAIIKTALEEMYNLAEKFQADVIYCENFFTSEGEGDAFLKNIHTGGWTQSGTPVKEPTFITGDLIQRMIDLMNLRISACPPLKLLLRDFLVSNQITFPNIIQEDTIWTLKLLCFAKKFIRVPNIVYIRRLREGSITAATKSFNDYLRKWMDRTIIGIKFTDEFMGTVEIFKRNPGLRYAILDFYSTLDFQRIVNISKNLPPPAIYETFKNEFKEYLGNHDVLVSYLATNNIRLIRNLMQAQQKIKLLEKKINAS